MTMSSNPEREDRKLSRPDHDPIARVQTIALDDPNAVQVHAVRAPEILEHDAAVQGDDSRMTPRSQRIFERDIAILISAEHDARFGAKVMSPIRSQKAHAPG